MQGFGSFLKGLFGSPPSERHFPQAADTGVHLIITESGALLLWRIDGNTLTIGSSAPDAAAFIDLVRSRETDDSPDGPVRGDPHRLAVIVREIREIVAGTRARINVTFQEYDGAENWVTIALAPQYGATSIPWEEYIAAFQAATERTIEEPIEVTGDRGPTLADMHAAFGRAIKAAGPSGVPFHEIFAADRAGNPIHSYVGTIGEGSRLQSATAGLRFVAVDRDPPPNPPMSVFSAFVIRLTYGKVTTELVGTPSEHGKTISWAISRGGAVPDPYIFAVPDPYISMVTDLFKGGIHHVSEGPGGLAAISAALSSPNNRGLISSALKSEGNFYIVGLTPSSRLIIAGGITLREAKDKVVKTLGDAGFSNEEAFRIRDGSYMFSPKQLRKYISAQRDVHHSPPPPPPRAEEVAPQQPSRVSVVHDGQETDLEIVPGTARYSDNGQLEVTLAKNQTIQGVPCDEGTVFFYENGQLAIAPLAKGYTTNRGIHCAAGENIVFHPNGELRFATVHVSFDEKGNPIEPRPGGGQAPASPNKGSAPPAPPAAGGNPSAGSTTSSASPAPFSGLVFITTTATEPPAGTSYEVGIDDTPPWDPMSLMPGQGSSTLDTASVGTELFLLEMMPPAVQAGAALVGQ